MSLLLNRCQFTTATTGTGPITVGSATSKFQTPASAGAVNGGVYSYAIEDGTAWEVGTGTYSTTGPTLTRTLIQSSTGALLSLSGSATVTISPNVADFATPDLFGTPGTPPSGLVRFGESALAGFDWPSFRAAQTNERFVQPLLSHVRYGGLVPAYGSTVLNYVGGNWQINTSAIAAGGSSSSAKSLNRMPTSLVGNSATAGTVGSIYCSGGWERPLFFSDGSGGCGFTSTITFAPSTGCSTVTDYRAWAGVTVSNVAATNVDPLTLTNIIAIARLPGSNNLQLIWAGSQSMTSGGRTPVDLGANFPANTVDTDLYRFTISSNPNDASTVGWRVERITGSSNAVANVASGTIANTTPGTTLPASTAGMSMVIAATNNTTASQLSWRFASWYFWAD